MAESPLPAALPVIYLVYGDDEIAIAQFIVQLKEKQADPSGMNFMALDGRALSFDDFVMATSVLPFMTSRRLVVLSNPLASLKDDAARQRFMSYLPKIPPSTALVLVEQQPLTSDKMRRANKTHWLEDWARQAGDWVFVQECRLPEGAAMAGWIRKRAADLGGEFHPRAADALAGLVGRDARLADQEIRKLLDYVNYERPVQADEVDLLTANYGETSIFQMVDALGSRNGRQAIATLHRLLESQDAQSIFGMVVRQFRLILLSREILDGGGGEAEVARRLKIPSYVASKIVAQARRFSLQDLETLYHRLLEIDVAGKSSEVDTDLGLDLLIADLMS